MDNAQVARMILDEIKLQLPKTKEELNKLKYQFARVHKLKTVPTDIELSNHATDSERKEFRSILSIKPVRTAAGVAPVALMTKPHKCPHGTCTYCPGGPDSVYGSVPQAYTGTEPATRRAIRNKYDPYLQVMNRLEHYVAMNQVPEKVEIIVMGGTFLSLHKSYKDGFIRDVFKALNDFGELFYKDGEIDFTSFNAMFEMEADKEDKDRQQRIHDRLMEIKNRPSTLEDEQLRNETTKIRCVSLVIETGAEACDINELLRFGCTRVELGIQSVYADVVEAINRGHTAQDSIDKTRELKDACYKITYHVMPGLPDKSGHRISYERDLEGLKILFSNPNWRPDMLKVYPCLVMLGTKLYQDYKEGIFEPLETTEASKMIAEFLKDIPDYVRIMRMQRDIPTYMTEDGVDRTNLRQYIDTLLKEAGVETKEIRSREITRKPATGDVAYKVLEYEASEGMEYFIEAGIGDSIVGFARLRFPGSYLRSEITSTTALLRELHVYGTATPLGEEGDVQHKGVGRELMKMAENIAKEHAKDHMLVISGVGVKEYYRQQLGYEKQGPFMGKRL